MFFGILETKIEYKMLECEKNHRLAGSVSPLEIRSCFEPAETFQFYYVLYVMSSRNSFSFLPVQNDATK